MKLPVSLSMFINTFANNGSRNNPTVLYSFVNGTSTSVFENFVEIQTRVAPSSAAGSNPCPPLGEKIGLKTALLETPTTGLTTTLAIAYL